MPVSVFASGGYPERCHHGHDWRARSSVIIGWMPCDCLTGTGRLGHHWVRCQTEGCTSIWYDPPHKPAAPASLPQAGA